MTVLEHLNASVVCFQFLINVSVIITFVCFCILFMCSTIKTTKVYIQLLLKQAPISSAYSMVTSHGLCNVFGLRVNRVLLCVCVCACVLFNKKTRIELAKNTWNSVLSLKV